MRVKKLERKKRGRQQQEAESPSSLNCLMLLYRTGNLPNQFFYTLRATRNKDAATRSNKKNHCPREKKMLSVCKSLSPGISSTTRPSPSLSIGKCTSLEKGHFLSKTTNLDLQPFILLPCHQSPLVSDLMVN